MQSTTMQRQRFLFAALGLLTLWRWALLPTLDLAQCEALAVFSIKHGQWDGFFELGPLLQLFAWVGMLIGGASEWGVRLFAPLLALAASLAMWRLACEMYDRQIAGWTVVFVNVLPAFNLAAVTLTPATIACTLVPVAALCLRRVLVHEDAPPRAWWVAGACVALAQPPAFAFFAAVVFVFALPRRLRHHLHGSGFRVIAVAWLVVVFGWLLWQAFHGWPAAWQLLPEWRLVPNLLRWMVLASPVLLTLFVLTVRVDLAGTMRTSRLSLPMAMLLPLAVMDFFYGTHEGWPNMGGMVWMLFAAMLLAHRMAVTFAAAVEQKVSLRTIAIVLAAVQSAVLLQGDLLRTLGLPWRFSGQAEAAADYTHFLTADPSRVMRGWRESARLLSAIQQQAGGAEAWFILASERSLAFELDHYLGQTEPVQAWGADLRAFAGRSALFVTVGRDAAAPPEALQKGFERIELLSVARVMHAGNEVRWLKIFACHDYRAPEL